MRVQLRRLVFAAVLLAPGFAQAADVTVMISGGFLSTLKDLTPGFERATILTRLACSERG